VINFLDFLGDGGRVDLFELGISELRSLLEKREISSVDIVESSVEELIALKILSKLI
jgi:hypothetical protein